MIHNNIDLPFEMDLIDINALDHKTQGRRQLQRDRNEEQSYPLVICYNINGVMLEYTIIFYSFICKLHGGR